MDGKVDISGLDKAIVLKALWDGSHAQGFSFVELPDDGNITLEECQKEVEERAKRCNGKLFFDYWRGKVLKVSIEGDDFDPYLYDRDCGPGHAAEVIDNLRASLEAE